MRSLIFALMFIPSLAFGEVIKLKETCTDDQGNQITNLKQCQVDILDPGTANVVASLVQPASSANGCQVLSFNTTTVNNLIKGAREIIGYCQTDTGLVSAASNKLAYTFRGNKPASPIVQEVQGQ